MSGGDPGGGVESFVQALQGHVKGNVDEVLLRSGGGTGELEERVDAECWEPGFVAGPGNGLAVLVDGWAILTRGIGPGSDHQHCKNCQHYEPFFTSGGEGGGWVSYFSCGGVPGAAIRVGVPKSSIVHLVPAGRCL